jgi:TatD DNase family protein
MLIDTHAHLYLEEFDPDRGDMIGRAIEAGVEAFYLPNIDSSSIDAMLTLETDYPGRCFPMMGLHPCSVRENYEEELQLVEQWLNRRPFPAIGEIGIDLYWDTSFFESQKKAFLRQVGWAKELELPIIIHSRNSIDIIIELLKKEKDERLLGIFHCFSGTEEQAHAIMELGFYMGIGGVLTFKKSGLDEAVKNIPLDWLVLETDAPYLAPMPFRGKRNESAYIRLVAEKLALVKNIDFEEVASCTNWNAKKIFDKKPYSYTTLC